jgi:hypothetical protein
LSGRVADGLSGRVADGLSGRVADGLSGRVASVTAQMQPHSKAAIWRCSELAFYILRQGSAALFFVFVIGVVYRIEPAFSSGKFSAWPLDLKILAVKGCSPNIVISVGISNPSHHIQIKTHNSLDAKSRLSLPKTLSGNQSGLYPV